LGRIDAGQETIFGEDKPEYTSYSQMSTIQVKKNMKTFVPVLQQQKTAEQRKNEELYGKTVVVQG